MEHLLDVQGLKTHFHMHKHIVRAVDGLDFHLDRGETLGIVGESGCGKSQTAMSMLRLVPEPPGKIEAGRIFFEGNDLLALTEEEMRKVRGNRISMIFQEPMTSLNPVYTVGDQVSEVLILHRGMTKDQALEESRLLLESVGIPAPEERVHDYPFQLSGGLRQRVMIAMAMACNPAILIADEPTTALDVTIQAQILRVMQKLKETHDTSIMFITHDMAVIAGFADRVMVMYAGVAVETAPVRTIFTDGKHPYTLGLLASVPKLGEHKGAPGERRFLTTIPGTLPDPKNFPVGCRFADRCAEVMPKCREAEPALKEVAAGHSVRCFLVHGEAAGSETKNEAGGDDE